MINPDAANTHSDYVEEHRDHDADGERSIAAVPRVRPFIMSSTRSPTSVTPADSWRHPSLRRWRYRHPLEPLPGGIDAVADQRDASPRF